MMPKINLSDELIQEIKQDEGFKGNAYRDKLGFWTIGYGTKLPLSKYEAEMILRYRLEQSIQELINAKPFITGLPQGIQEILFNMAYNLGVPKLLKFRKMFEALEERNYCKAADEMIDSRWYYQVPSRAGRLVGKMRSFCNM